jgi:uncharacterized membrane protein YfcA
MGAHRLTSDVLILLAVAMLSVAFLYSSVGQAGASGYVALLSFTQLAPTEIKPIALALNISVATISTFQFARSGLFSWRLFLPLAIPSIPAAYIGGFFHAPVPVFNGLLGTVLMISAVLLLLKPKAAVDVRACPLPIIVVNGAGLGLLAGATATGGGVMLTPILIFSHWAEPRTAAAISAPFILVNSIAAMLATVRAEWHLPSNFWVLWIAVTIGGLAGSFFGSRVLPQATIRSILAVVVFVAGAKLLTTLSPY